MPSVSGAQSSLELTCAKRLFTEWSLDVLVSRAGWSLVFFNSQVLKGLWSCWFLELVS